MTELETIQFGGIGLPHLENGIAQPGSEAAYPVGEMHVWPYADDVHAMDTRQPSKNTEDYIIKGINELNPFDASRDPTGTLEHRLGGHATWEIVFGHRMFHDPQDDTFVLRHADLDFQNILTDTDGNITGIIDWHSSMAVPRCIGHAAVPLFLRSDWFPNDITRRPHMIFSYDHYREFYGAAIVKVGNPDAIYTTKSAIYMAAFATMYEGGGIMNFAQNVLHAIPSFRRSVVDFLGFLGQPNGMDIWQPFLNRDLKTILEPELPHITWDDVQADLAAREWMSSFDEMVVYHESG